MKVHYVTKGTCSTAMDVEVTDGIVTQCVITRGCAGNTQGLSKMVIGRPAQEVIRLLRGIQCRNGTSCPDQLSYAVEQALNA